MLNSSFTSSTLYWRNIVSASWLAVDSIRAHKLRTFLTLLGVIVGVASVIMVGAAIEGLGTYATESTSKVFGSNTFLIAQVANAVSRSEYLRQAERKPADPAGRPEIPQGDDRRHDPIQRLQPEGRGYPTRNRALGGRLDFRRRLGTAGDARNQPVRWTFLYRSGGARGTTRRGHRL